MSDNVLNLTDDNFAATVQNGTTLVDFWAEWCGPCRMQAPIVEEMAEKLAGKAQICKLNIDENPQTAASYDVMSIPTTIIFKDGEVVQKLVGLQDEQSLTAALDL